MSQVSCKNVRCGRSQEPLPPGVPESLYLCSPTCCMETIETFGFPRVVAMHDHGTQYAMIQTESVDGDYIDLMVPEPAARKLTEELKHTLKEME